MGAAAALNACPGANCAICQPGSGTGIMVGPAGCVGDSIPQGSNTGTPGMAEGKICVVAKWGKIVKRGVN